MRKTAAPSMINKCSIKSKAFPHNGEWHGVSTSMGGNPLGISYFTDESRGIIPLKHINSDFLKISSKQSAD